MEAVLPSLPVAEAAAGAVRSAPAQEAHFTLLRRCQRHDPGAFDELVRTFHARVFSTIRAILRNSNDVEDLAQQIFTKVYFALDKFNFQSAVSTWVYKIAVNECYDHLRKLKVRRSTILADLSADEAARIENLDVAGMAGTASLERQVETRELAEKLLARVSVDDRILLILKEVDGYSVREVAQLLGLNENTVKVRLFRARQALMQAVKRRRV
ncbi:MAG TPA: sigma-70 family RNA polymerase sigma factor [Terriglobales bacterium]|nr:sigma-70 family RNA polymerase sigma factor [Terriglobales bacterium]